MPSAEFEYRKAFQRLKENRPERLPLGSPISQNNIAKEAGKEPSALRKRRYPELIDEIQRHIRATRKAKPLLAGLAAEAGARRELRRRLRDVEEERDMALSLLVEADAKILELANELAKIKAAAKD